VSIEALNSRAAIRGDAEVRMGEIRRVTREKCPACGGTGPVIYRGLKDRQYGVPGEWTLRRCAGAQCGTLFLDPVPIPEDLVRTYENDNFYTHQETPPQPTSGLRALYSGCVASYLARRWGYPAESARVATGALLYLDPLHRFYADRSVMFLPACPGGRLLDIGCGGGEFLIRAKKLGWTVEGVDFDPIAVDLARKRGLTVHLGSLHDQRLPSAAYNSIVMSHLIEHVPDPFALLRECHRIMKPGGRLVALTPNTESFAHGRFRENWFYLDTPRHLQLFNAASLLRLARDAGFESAEVASGCHGAAFNFVASPIIRRTGCFDPNTPWPLWTKMRSLAWEFAELALIAIRPLAGEELRLVAVKAA
jgi:2-polyprenyl-3-methyl-5-hydroxy-6-metoxy-1,4-benzoquinol methylase